MRLAVRALCSTPIVSFVAALSLALGLGANTAIFTLVNSLLLRPLPVADPDRLASIVVGTEEAGGFSYTMFEELRRHRQVFDSACLWSLGGTTMLTFGQVTQPVEHQFVSGDYFSTLGVPALVGRTLTPADDVPGGGPDGAVAMISYRLWETRFGGAASIVGARVRLDRAAVTIVGVTPPGFSGLVVGRGFDVTLPIRNQPLLQPATPLADDMFWLRVTARLKPGQALEAATEALRAVQPPIREAGGPGNERRPSFLKDPFVLAPLAHARSPLRDRFERPLLIILAVTALVLVIACANIANLMLARGAARRHELSVRVALGASRWQLARQLLAESVLLTSAGALGGLVLGLWASGLIVGQLSTGAAPVVLDRSLDWRVLAFTAAAMASTVAIFGVAPAVRATRVAPIDALKDPSGAGARVTNAADAHHGLGVGGLISAQVALSLVLVVGAGLFVRTFERLAAAPLGFDRDRVLVVTVTAPTVPAADRNRVYHRLVREAAAVPGVAAAGGTFNPPIVGRLIGDLVVSRPGVAPPPDAEHISQATEVTTGWFAAYGTPIRAGRDFDGRDTLGSPPVIVVNDAFAQRFFPNRSPVGESIAVTFRMAPFGDVPLGTKTIVGVVGDAVYRSIRDPRRPTMYFSLAQRDDPLLFTNFYIAVRSAAGAPALLSRSVAAALTAVNPDLTLAFDSLDDQVTASLAQDRVVAMLSGYFGTLALVLASLGLYGVTAYAVARRRTEIGIRMALGAAPAGVVRLVLKRVAALVAAGVAVGAGLSLWASRLVASLLYGVEPHDPTILGAAILTLSLTGALAGWLPAHRASRIDPAQALREQ